VNAGWLAAIAAVIVAIPVAVKITQQVVSASSPWKRQKRRELAWTRMAEHLASNCSEGYPDHYGRYLEHFLGGRQWQEGWGTDGWERRTYPTRSSRPVPRAQRSGVLLARRSRAMLSSSA
jgi:hypothetical protein